VGVTGRGGAWSVEEVLDVDGAESPREHATQTKAESASHDAARARLHERAFTAS
jgi:hypothetical protein